jgi:carbon storage regulator
LSADQHAKEIKQMLVLSRKESERIRLGDSIVVTVVRVAGDKVRLGIEAPSDILVLREELEPQARAIASPAADE